LANIAIERRRRFAATLGLFAALFVAVGVVAATTPGAVRIFSAIALTVATLLGLMAWGVTHSVKLDQAEQRLDRTIDRAITEAIAARGGSAGDLACGCGHDHDPDEMHVSGESCSHDGTGVECTHSCDTCVLAALRPSPTRSRAERLAQQSVTDSVVQRQP